MRSDFIDDGYTETALIPASVAGERQPHGAVEITYRPHYGRDRSAVSDAAGKSAVEYFDATVELLPKYLQSWSLKNSKGDPVKVNKQTVAALNPNLREKIVGRVFCFVEGAVDAVEADLKN